MPSPLDENQDALDFFNSGWTIRTAGMDALISKVDECCSPRAEMTPSSKEKKELWMMCFQSVVVMGEVW